MARIGGWMRIGVILSIAWIPIGWIYTNNTRFAQAHDFASAMQEFCLRPPSLPVERCSDEFMKSWALSIKGTTEQAELVSFGPIVPAWLIAWGTVALFRWVRRGFEGHGGKPT